MKRVFLRFTAMILIGVQLLSPMTYQASVTSTYNSVDENIQKSDFSQEKTTGMHSVEIDTATKDDVTTTENDTSKKDTNNQKKEKQEKQEKRNFKLDKHQFKKNESIKISLDNTDVENYYYETEGIDILNEDDNEMQFSISPKEGFGKIDVYSNLKEDKTVQSSLYTYTEDDMVFVSDVAKDQAWYDYKKYEYDNGMITKEEWEKEYSELCSLFTETEIIREANNKEKKSASSSGAVSIETAASATYVKGRICWELEDGTLLPLRQARIELWDNDIMYSQIVSMTFTDDDGYYSFKFSNSNLFENGGLDLFTRVHTESYTVSVVAPTHNILNLNHFDSKVVDNVETGSTTNLNYYIKYDDTFTLTKSVHVFQGMVLGQRFATAMGMTTSRHLGVLYPMPNPMNFSGELEIEGVPLSYVSSIGKESFDDIDILVHEYGHFVQHQLDIYGSSLSEILLNNPNHEVDTDHFSDKFNKKFAMELTWSESWASVFSLLAQEYYKTQYKGFPKLANGVMYGASNENYAPDENSGEAQEFAVMSMLWDLYDSTSSETFDKISLSYKKWWEYTTKPKTYTLTAFSNIIDTYYPQSRDEIGAIMAHYQISPGNLRVSNLSSVSKTTAPTLKWIVNGSIENPNNQFRVVFFDANDKKIAESSLIKKSAAYDSTITYAVPQSLWNTVLDIYDGTYTLKVAVCAYNAKNYPISGPYYSAFVSVPISCYETWTLNNTSRYKEQAVNIAPSGYVEFKVTPTISGYRIIQTFGQKDTILQLYNSSGSLVKTSDDDGYSHNALIYYYMYANTTYTIRVKFYSSVISGQTKLSITPATGALASTVSTIANYESIKNVKGYTGYSWGTYASLNYARVLTFTPPSSGDYTFEITSSFDTYIYVIDPTSTQIISSSTNYNDDGGEGLNAKLTTNLKSGRPYLIIYSGYNLTNSSHTGSLTLEIDKE